MFNQTIEAVTVCVNFGDFLKETAPINRALFDRWVVITTPEDEETRSVCKAHSIDCLLSQDFTRHNETFAKARGINKALDQLKGDTWIAHVDADIALPYDTLQCLHDTHLDPNCIYGCDRLNVTGWCDWQTVKAQGLYSRESGWLVEKRRPCTWVGGVPAGLGRGYAPIGFFQLWNATHTHSWTFPKKTYPETHGHSARTDVQFSLQWDRRHRVFIPELIVFHLESEPSPMGFNWKGRRSKKFGPPAKPTKPDNCY